MAQILSSKTAFNLYRTPPQVRALFPCLNIDAETSSRKALLRDPFVLSCLAKPIYLLSNEQIATNKKELKKRRWSGEIPKEFVWDIEGVGLVASPGFTLFTLAEELSFVELVMAMYEMCGTFAAFTPSAEVEALMQKGENKGDFHLYEKWSRVKNLSTGEDSNLWKRPPLTTKDELTKVAKLTKGRNGHSKFVKAIQCVSGVCASPFEVKASMLLSMPRCLGGKGLKIENNKEMVFSKKAARIAGKQRAFLDIYIDSKTNGRRVAIECQGGMVHDNGRSFLSDANRAAALQIMGIDVIPLTYKQIAQKDSFDAIVGTVSATLELRQRVKSERHQQQENSLRAALFQTN